MEEIAERFGQEPELRRVQMESLRWLDDASRRAGVERMIINGSFVTDALDPNDVDCVLLVGESFPSDTDAQAELIAGFPFLDVQLVGNDAFRSLVDSFFASDRWNRPKGMVEVIR